MNARRVQELMRERFPSFDAAHHLWVIVPEHVGPRAAMLSALLEEHIAAPEVIVQVHRKLGALLAKYEAVSFISTNLGEGQIKVADPAFRSFVVVAVNGVATGWQLGQA